MQGFPKEAVIVFAVSQIKVHQEEKNMKLTLVCEHNAWMDKEEFRDVYPERIENYLAGLYKGFGYDVTLIVLDRDSDGGELTDEILEETEVLVWWSHWYNKNLRDDVAFKVVSRVNRGMGFCVLHSAHHCKPFKYLMGTSCNLSWHEVNERERVWCIDKGHPIARGIGDSFVIPHEEMYGEPFDIPTPDESIFLSWFEGGEVMRSGCVWKRGRGKVFFFRPGHETNPTYRQSEVQRILENAAGYVAPAEIVAPYDCPCIKNAPEGPVGSQK